MRLVLSQVAYTDLIHHAKTGYPDEICGLLTGRGELVMQIIPTKNGASDTKSAFLIPTGELNDHLPKLRAEGLNLVGFYHSHPNSPAIPSPTDVRELDNGLKLPHVLVGITPPYTDIKGWWIENGQVNLIEIVVGDEFLTEPNSPSTPVQSVAFLLSIGISLVVLITIALTLLPPAPKLP
ncbi:MAG: M67 family metallopeptidase [Anaerolineae bacterium]|jgi:proteasome lid subunit RPN8/RPN11|nr:M67 family metallopeptidase [Anaerolineae bacterium]